ALFLTWLIVAYREVGPPGPVRRGWAFAAGALFLGALEACLASAALINIYGWQWQDLRSALAEREAGAIAAASAILAAPPLAIASWLCLRHSRAPARGWQQRWRDRRAVALGIAALAAILIGLNLNYQASLFWRRWDLSAAGVNALSCDTRLVLNALSDRVDIYVFFSDKIDYQGVPLLRRVRELLDEYRSQCAYIHPHYTDAVLEPEEAARAAAALGLDLGQMPQVAVVEYRGRRRLVPAHALLKQPDIAQRMAGMRAATFHGELGFTLALKQLLDPRVARVYLAAGHGELAVSGLENQPQSMGKWVQALRHSGLDPQPIILKGQDLPADAAVLILAGPRLPLGREVVSALQRYLESGGRLLLLFPEAKLAGAASDGEEDPDLTALAAACGARVEANAVFDTRNNDNGVASAILAVTPEGTALAPSGQQAVCVLPYARTLRENLEAERGGWLLERLLTSCETAIARTKIDPREKPRRGPHTLAVAAVRPAAPGRPEARAVIVGNAAFVSNLFVERMHNREWALGLVHWLTGRDYQLRIPPPQYPDRTLNLSGAQQRLIFWASVVAMPQIWLIFAVLVWWARRE
ncbi:MAG: Gldg family protein, partial [Planctomycetota bacterium]|nr:Gldg family protein [Planctomycetota bacterium]